jgi:hypothetical protein
LQAGPLAEMTRFEQFEQTLRVPGPWIAGIDFPFGQSRKFIENMGWPRTWAGYVARVQRLGRQGFCDALNAYRARRAYGDKEHKRKTDQAAGSISPQKLYGVPVALMFFEGAGRLRAAGVTIPYLQVGDPNRIVVEAYPGVFARQLIGRRAYKSDTKKKQSDSQRESRRALLAKITGGAVEDALGFAVEAPTELADDPSGDQLDALLCAIQAAWAWNLPFCSVFYPMIYRFRLCASLAVSSSLAGQSDCIAGQKRAFRRRASKSSGHALWWTI